MNKYNIKIAGVFIFGGIFALSLNNLLQYIIDDILLTVVIENFFLGYL